MNKPTLVSITQFVNPNWVPQDNEISKYFKPEDAIVYMARVSSPNQRTENSVRLLRFLVKHGHWSPFDMIDVTFEIETSRAIMAQILRHWSFRFQEFSQRYSEVPIGLSINEWEHVEARFKNAGGNRQGSDEENETPMGLEYLAQKVCVESSAEYKRLIDAGIAPECARMVLPLATPTRAYMKGSVRSWMTYFWQRLDKHAQKEHRQLAEQMFEIFSEHFPIISKLIEAGKPTYVENVVD